MYYDLSFARVHIHDDNIAEVIVNNNVEITLEMAQEYEAFLTQLFTGKFALLINKINQYNYTYEAKLTIGSNANIVAIAVIHYDRLSKMSTDSYTKARQVDRLNLKQFSGLELGHQQALKWLKSALHQTSRQSP